MMRVHANAAVDESDRGMRMTATSTESLVRSLYDIFNDRALDRIRQYITDDYEVSSIATGETFRGADGYRQFMQRWIDAFPDAHVEIVNIVASEDGACVEFRGSGTQTGTFGTPMGDIPPSGKHVEVPFCDVHHLRDGRVTHSHMYFDVATLMRQLGIGQ
jgi:steroid delta-isomerase-like uncharacterized protein